MSEALTFTPEQKTQTPVEITEGLGQLALQGAISTAERGGFTLPEGTEAELQTLFDVDPFAPELPLAPHGNGCGETMSGEKHPGHGYIFRGFKLATE